MKLQMRVLVGYAFHIAHGPNNYVEDQVIQFKATGVGSNQKVTMYGPATPQTTGTMSRWVASSGSVPYNQTAKLKDGVMLYAGPRQDPFYFDVTQFFLIIPDRNGKLGIVHVWATTSIDRSGNGAYAQIERLGRPAVKEATESFRDHDATNRTTPTGRRIARPRPREQS